MNSRHIHHTRYSFFSSIGFEQDHQILLVYDGENHGCLIDTSLVLDSLVTIPSLRVDKTLVTIIGYLERTVS